MDNFNLEQRTLDFAKQIIRLCKMIKLNTINIEIIKQLVRSAGSIGANYREANDSLGPKDFIYRLRICRKEAKETLYWLELLLEANNDKESVISSAEQEVGELIKIFSAIITKLDNKQQYSIN